MIFPTIIFDAANHLENKNHPDPFPVVLLPSSQQFYPNTFEKKTKTKTHTHTHKGKSIMVDGVSRRIIYFCLYVITFFEEIVTEKEPSDSP